MYSKYNCNGKFQVSAIKLISATLCFIYFFKMIKLLKWVTFSHINFCNKDIPYLGLNAPINVFSQRGWVAGLPWEIRQF